MLVILNAGLFAKQLLPELVLVYRGREWANTLRRNPITRLTDNTSSIAAICIFCNAKRWIYYRTPAELMADMGLADGTEVSY